MQALKEEREEHIYLISVEQPVVCTATLFAALISLTQECQLSECEPWEKRVNLFYVRSPIGRTKYKPLVVNRLEVSMEGNTIELHFSLG